MGTLAAAASGLPAGTVAIIAVVLLAGYGWACAFWPLSACGRCSGTGKSRSPSRKHWRPCKRCSGSGRRIRLGRRVFTTLTPRRDRERS